MGILNVTPDSFYDGGRLTDGLRIRDRALEMIAHGASILDIGAESTRPGSDPVTVEEEMERLDTVFRHLVPELSGQVLFSIDTTKPEIAQAAMEAGVHLINDVSGDLSTVEQLGKIAARHGAGYVVMHSKGRPKTMQLSPDYVDVVSEVGDWLAQAVSVLERVGVSEVIVDPGIGFGKTLMHNLALIRHIPTLSERCGGRPVLIGASRKSLVGTLTGRVDPEDRLHGTIALHYEAMLTGAHILRVHDVRPAMDSVNVFKAFHTGSDVRMGSDQLQTPE